MQDLKISIIQTNQIWENKKANFQNFEKLLEQYVDSDILIFPEMFHTGFTMNTQEMAESMNGLGMDWLIFQAKKWNTVLIASLIIEDEESYYNRFVFVRPTGEIDFYNKQKLFTLAGEDHYFTKGESNSLISFKGWKILPQICYDLRFPEQCRNKLNQLGEPTFDLIIYVANWPKKRSLHWKSLLRARAIENQSYVVGVNRIGSDANNLEYAGDSMIIDPLGEEVLNCYNHSGLFNGILKHEELIKTRVDLPFLKDQ